MFIFNDCQSSNPNFFLNNITVQKLMKNLNSGLFCNKKVNFTEKQKTFDMNFFLNDGR